MRESYKECSLPITEPCPYHPVDCPNCEDGDVCQMREDMQSHPNIIRRCRFFRKKKERLL